METLEKNIIEEAKVEKKWYRIEVENTFSELNSSEGGLAGDEAAQRLEKFGSNSLPSKEPPSIFKIIINQFLNPLIYILLFAGVFALAIGDVKDSVFIFLVIAINAAIGAIQEWKAEKSSEALQSMLKIYSNVLRDGKEKKIPSEEIVPGDIVLLESGDKVPADIRLFKINNLSVDESLLTGESVAIEKNLNIYEEDRDLAERKNMVFAGSVVVSGRSRGVVVETALNTEIGKIAEAITTVDVSKAPLIVRMEKFAKQISIIVVIACIILGVIEFLKGNPLKDVFFLATALAVSAIPEGLPAALTVALSVGMSRMAKNNVIIKKLTAVEGLGSCTTIASDKTGTLTINKQTAKLLVTPDGEEFNVSGEGYSGDGSILDSECNEINNLQAGKLKELVSSSVICNEAKLYKEGNNWTSNGDAVDIAMFALGYKMGSTPDEIKENVNSLFEIPFESERGFSGIYFEKDGQNKVAVKGAAEKVSDFCSGMFYNNEVVNIDKDQIHMKALDLASRGYRVIGVASGSFDRDKLETYKNRSPENLVFLGFVCLIDPLRPEAIDAVAKNKKAGIKTIMVTGDHPETAFAIGKDLGIADSKAQVMTGKQLEQISKEELAVAIDKINIFARVTPIQKLDIVTVLTEKGHFIAVTGDGVNDAPALKKANISVAMGSGTDVAKDVSSIIVTDDNFSSIVAGVEEGRYTYDNIRKVIYLLISTGAAEIFLFLFAVSAGMPIPLIAVQLLWLNLVTNGIQGVALAFEKGEDGAMQRPPRAPSEGIFNKLMVRQTVLSGFVMSSVSFGVWFYLKNAGWALEDARNVVLLLMVLFENVHVFNCRSEYSSAFKVPLKNNVMLIAGVFAAFGIHMLSMYIPVMQDVLGVRPVSIEVFFLMLGLALSLLVAMELFKFISKKLSGKEYF